MSTHHSLTLNNASVEWDLARGDLRFFGLSSVLFWADPSLYRMLAPLAQEMGHDLFRLLVAQSSSLGTDEDYEAMVTKLGSSFEEGFLAWGRAVGVAGWGAFSLPAFDRAQGTALVRVRNPWELRVQRAHEGGWGCPFMLGKVIGLFRHALGRPCWADEAVTEVDGEPVVEFKVYASEQTIDAQIAELRRQRLDQRERELEARITQARQELREGQEQLQAQQDTIRTMETPIIQVWDGVLVVPLVGELTSERAQAMGETLLMRVNDLGARDVVLDLTGISSFDEQSGDLLNRTVMAVQLIGARCTVVGLSPRVTQILVGLDIRLTNVRTLRTLADALKNVVGLTGGQGR